MPRTGDRVIDIMPVRQQYNISTQRWQPEYRANAYLVFVTDHDVEIRMHTNELRGARTVAEATEMATLALERLWLEYDGADESA